MTVCLPATEVISIDAMASVDTVVWQCRLCDHHGTTTTRPTAHSESIEHLSAEHHATIGTAPRSGPEHSGNLRAEDLALALLNFGSIPSKRVTRPSPRSEPQHARRPYNILGVLEDRTKVFRTHGHVCVGGTLDLEQGRFPAQLRTVWPVRERVARDTVLHLWRASHSWVSSFWSGQVNM